MKRIVLSIMMVLGAFSGSMAQDSEASSPADEEDSSNKVQTTISADFVSSYLWRGGKMDNAAIQPTLGIEYKGLSLSAWGSYGITSQDAVKELDLTLGYTVGGFNIGITDYWSTTDDGAKYFVYSNDETAHTFEANIGYDFGPVNFQWYTNFAGYDGLRCNGKRAYLSYFELSAPFKLGGVDWTATVGAIPYSAYAGDYVEEGVDEETGETLYGWEPYYESNSCNFAVTNISLRAEKAIKLSKNFSLPLFAQLMGNPSAQKLYFAFGLTLNPFQ